MDSDMRECVGVVHLHSTYSDGSGRIPDILDAARQTETDFVVLTDHDTAAARREGWEGRHQGVTLAVGIEVTPPSTGHCLVLGMDYTLGFARMREKEYLDRIVEGGGFAIVPHPAGKLKRSLLIRQVPWREWWHPAVKGLEIWSYMHDWIDKLHAFRLHEIYDFWRRPHERIRGPAPRLLRLWDHLCRRRRYAACAGIDCHARQLPLTHMVVFPYADMFRTLRVHLFIEEGRAPATPSEIVHALREGSGFVSYDCLSDARGTIFDGESRRGDRLLMGREYRFEAPVRLRAAAPRPADLRLLCNGRPMRETHGRDLDFTATEAGAYRLEGYLDGQAWLFTNPIYLRDADGEF